LFWRYSRAKVVKKEVKPLTVIPVPNDWEIHGVAVFCLDSDGKIIMVVESDKKERPRAGKYAGMLSIPMGGVKKGEPAEATAIREFGEETGLEVRIEYPLAFVEIDTPERNRVGVWAFKGELTGNLYTARENERLRVVRLSEKEFLETPSFYMRPRNFEIYNSYVDKRELLGQGVPLGLVRELAIKASPPGARQWLGGE